LISFEEARRLFLSRIRKFGMDDTEILPVEEAHLRVSAESVASPIDIPHYDRAKMDGYAVRSSATKGASRKTPVELLVGEEVSNSTCVWVNTGDAMPEGSDAVVKVEDVVLDGDVVKIYRAVKPFENVERKGEKVGRGDIIVRKGDVLKAAHIALLRSAGVRKIGVFRKPRVLVVPTGDELIEPNDDLVAGKIFESNGLMISCYIREWGGEAVQSSIVRDDPVKIRKVLMSKGFDLIVTTGGTSVGKRDHVYRILSDCGEVLFRGVALRPGKSAIAGVVESTPVLSMPGTPAACISLAHLFLKPAIYRMLNRGGEVSFEVKLEGKIISKTGYTDFVAVSVDFDTMAARPVSNGELGMVDANGYVLIPEEVKEFGVGKIIVYLI